MPGPSFYARVSRLSAIILILPSSMGAGWILGYFALDRWLGTFPLGSIIFTLVGAGSGFYQIMKILALDQRDERNQPAEK